MAAAKDRVAGASEREASLDPSHSLTACRHGCDAQEVMRADREAAIAGSVRSRREKHRAIAHPEFLPDKIIPFDRADLPALLRSGGRD